MSIKFDVSGVPAPKGSARAVRNRWTGRAMLLASSSPSNEAKQRSWAASVGWSARCAMRGRPFPGPVAVTCVFRFARPASHTKAQRATDAHASKPDVDKLLRCTLDALSGIAFEDDRQVCNISGIKRYCADGEEPGAVIEVRNIEPACGPGRSET